MIRDGMHFRGIGLGPVLQLVFLFFLNLDRDAN